MGGSVREGGGEGSGCVWGSGEVTLVLYPPHHATPLASFAEDKQQLDGFPIPVREAIHP